MKKKLRLLAFRIIVIVLVIQFGFVANSLASAAIPNTGILASASSSAACSALNSIDTSQNCETGGSSLTNVISTVVNILSWVVGIAAVIMIIISGFKFITSAGDANKASSARSTLIYALVGVVIAFLAQFLVHFVINKTKGS